MHKIEFHCGDVGAVGTLTTILAGLLTQKELVAKGAELVTAAKHCPVAVFCNDEGVLLGLRVAVARLELAEDPDVTVYEHHTNKNPLVGSINRYGRLSDYPAVFDHHMDIICELLSARSKEKK
jgi:hypothetical protein